MPQWHIGCSGFYYPEWKKLFYPEGLPQSKWFSYYCTHFNTLELNVTFYRFPQPAQLQNWYHKSPADFVFSVKAPRDITHYQQFAGTEKMLVDFYQVIREGLREKLGCVLFQLPAQFVYSEERLQLIVDSLDTTFTNVVEFRHVSWWQPSVSAALAARSIICCSISHPKLPDAVMQHAAGVYYRFHGVPQLYKSEYPSEKLLDVINQIKETQVEKAYLYFNNTMGMAGINNARQAMEMVKGQE